MQSKGQPLFFLRYAEDMAACFVSENEAGRCTFSTAFLNYMMDTKYRLSKLCEGNCTYFSFLSMALLFYNNNNKKSSAYLKEPRQLLQ